MIAITTMIWLVTINGGSMAVDTAWQSNSGIEQLHLFEKFLTPGLFFF